MSEPLTAAVSTTLPLALIQTITTKYVLDKRTLIQSTVHHTVSGLHHFHSVCPFIIRFSLLLFQVGPTTGRFIVFVGLSDF